VALAETAFSGGLGMDVDLAAVPASGIARDDEMLFSETQSRFVVTVRPEKKAAFEAALAGHAIGCIGAVTGDGLFRVKGLKGGVILEEKDRRFEGSMAENLAVLVTAGRSLEVEKGRREEGKKFGRPCRFFIRRCSSQGKKRHRRIEQK
jgi:phosphoribosylformylglycinamidine (FGAM) synthase-like enzyme